MKIAVMFSGQGAQKCGMGKDFYDNFAKSKEIFDNASDILGYNITDICFNENDLINKTEYCQPAILTTSLAIYEIFKENFKTDVAMGLSLGEYTALTSVGAFSLQDAIKIIDMRAKSMAQDCINNPGTMAAVLNVEQNVIEQACSQAKNYVAVANINTTGQIVISGTVEGVQEAIQILKDNGAKKILPLKVSGAFHTKLFDNTKEMLQTELAKINFNPMTIEVIGNLTAKPIPFEDIVNNLSEQVVSPVLFSQSIENCINNGVDTFIEIGVGSTLKSFVKKINSDVKVLHIEDIKTLDEALMILN